MVRADMSMFLGRVKAVAPTRVKKYLVFSDVSVKLPLFLLEFKWSQSVPQSPLVWNCHTFWAC